MDDLRAIHVQTHAGLICRHCQHHDGSHAPLCTLRVPAVLDPRLALHDDVTDAAIVTGPLPTLPRLATDYRDLGEG